MSTRIDILSQLGKRIAYLRKQKGMSQLDLSTELGLSQGYLCELETGKRNPSVKTLNRLCKALGVTLSELFQGVVEIDQLI